MDAAVAGGAVVRQPELPVGEKSDAHFIALAVAEERAVVEAHHGAVGGAQHANAEHGEVDRGGGWGSDFRGNIATEQKSV